MMLPTLPAALTTTATTAALMGAGTEATTSSSASPVPMPLDPKKSQPSHPRMSLNASLHSDPRRSSSCPTTTTAVSAPLGTSSPTTTATMASNHSLASPTTSLSSPTANSALHLRSSSWQSLQQSHHQLIPQILHTVSANREKAKRLSNPVQSVSSQVHSLSRYSTPPLSSSLSSTLSSSHNSISSLSEALMSGATIQAADDQTTTQSLPSLALVSDLAMSCKEDNNDMQFAVAKSAEGGYHSGLLDTHGDLGDDEEEEQEYEDADEHGDEFDNLFGDDDDDETIGFVPSLPLTPFTNQVGGHVSFLRFSDKALCKPLDPRERNFYELVEASHPELKPFMATYLGVVNVAYASSTSPATGAAEYNIAEGTPVVILDQNRHILRAVTTSDDDDDSDISSFKSARYNGHRRRRRRSFDALSTPSPAAECLPMSPTSFRSEKDIHRATSRRSLRNSVVTTCSSSPRAGLSTSAPRFLGTSSGSDRSSLRGLAGVSPSSCSDVNTRRLQTQVFKEALSPRSLRLRFAQVSSTSHTSSNLNTSCLSENWTNTRVYGNVASTHASNSQKKFNEEGDSHIFHMSDDDVGPNQNSGDMTPTLRRLSTSASTPTLSLRKVNDDKFFQKLSAAASRGPVFTDLSDITSIATPSVSRQAADASRERSSKEAPLSSTNVPLSSSGNPPTREFLLLEDLTDGLRAPCILDLKMGTRQYGVFATPKKRESQERKCAMSTSRGLGVRLCGMQVYNSSTGSYTYIDKYAGRKLTPATFHNALTSFLPTLHATTMASSILETLTALHTTILNLSHMRLYASSLLVLYDAYDPSRTPVVRMIDFAQCVGDVGCLVGATFPPTTGGADWGYLTGLRTLIKAFEGIVDGVKHFDNSDEEFLVTSPQIDAKMIL